MRESKDPTAKTVIFEDSVALTGIVLAAIVIYLTDIEFGPNIGTYRDGMASIAIGLVLAVVSFVPARTFARSAFGRSRQ